MGIKKILVTFMKFKFLMQHYEIFSLQKDPAKKVQSEVYSILIEESNFHPNFRLNGTLEDFFVCL